MKMEYIICIVVLVLVAIVGIIILAKNTKVISSFVNNITSSTTKPKKILKYFGNSDCPYSNKNSNAYIVIKEFDEYIKTKGDAQVIYYWAGTDDNIMDQHDIIYVPTILGKDNASIELKLPANTNPTDKSTDKLKQLLMDHIYSML